MKSPLSPVYLLLFGGGDLVVSVAILEMHRRRWLRRSIGTLRDVGRASLAVYVAQAHVYGALLSRVPSRYTPWWPLLFVETLVMMIGVARQWNRHDGKRLLTVGVAGPLKRRTARAAGGHVAIPYLDAGVATRALALIDRPPAIVVHVPPQRHHGRPRRTG